MLIYHGSKKIIEQPVFGNGNPNNDYGLGFYCTADLELAKEWACTNNELNGYANKYEINLNDLKVLDLTNNKYSILNWIAILLKHRMFDTNNPIAIEAKQFIISNYYIDVTLYDVVIGYRADDSYFTFAKDFINNTISLEQLSSAMHLGKLGIQIVIKSELAFQALQFLGYEIANTKIYYTKRLNRDLMARYEYFEKCRKNYSKDNVYILDIIRKGTN